MFNNIKLMNEKKPNNSNRKVFYSYIYNLQTEAATGIKHQLLVQISCATLSAVILCTHFYPFRKGKFNTYNSGLYMQRLYRTSCIIIHWRNIFWDVLFTLIIFTEHHKRSVHNTYKELPSQNIKINKFVFVLQVLSAKLNGNFFVNLLGVWDASIFVELYE